MFDSIINDAAEKFDLGDKAGALVSALLSIMTDRENGGFAGFLGRFREVGLGGLADSWIAAGANTPISYEQTESAFGNETLQDIADKTGIDYKRTTSATAYLVPHLVDDLTPDGVIPNDGDLLSRIGGYLSGTGSVNAGASGVTAGAFDRVDASVGNTTGDATTVLADDENSLLSWLLPLLILALLVIIGFWFCSGKSEPVATVNANLKKPETNSSATNTSSTAKTTDSQFTLTAKDGKYAASGVVPDQATLDKIKAALTAEFGAGNVDFSGLRVDASAKPFAADWWTNFEKMLPDLKGWTNGTLSFAGNAITAASGLPQAAMERLKSLFAGWTMSGVNTETSPNDENRTLSEVSLPDGKKLQAYPNGIEDQLIKFIESAEYKNGTDDTLKNRWFNFDDLNFKFGSTELIPESKRQLDNIVAILKAFPDVRIKIGGYTDKKGDDAANKKLSDDRAKAVKTALEKSGVGAQVPEAEGYGEEFATVAETAGDDERRVDRKTSVRLLK